MAAESYTAALSVARLDRQLDALQLTVGSFTTKCRQAFKAFSILHSKAKDFFAAPVTAPASLYRLSLLGQRRGVAWRLSFGKPWAQSDWGPGKLAERRRLRLRRTSIRGAPSG